MDKQKALKEFEDINGPSILLSSEVAAEGVDLQLKHLSNFQNLSQNVA